MKYLHGGMPSYYFKKFNISERPVIDFSVNINPIGPPPVIKEIWNELLQKISIYPDIEGKGIRQFYREKFHIPEDFVLPGNGSTEIIYLLSRMLPAKKILILKPSYFDYERATILAKKEVLSLYTDPVSEIEEKELIKCLYKADAIWIGRPNNPTGKLLPKELILSLAKDFPKKWIILDEAFIQFVKDWERETFISSEIPKNIFVIHSLTKFYALAGIRAGALISRPENISLISEGKEPWSVNILAEEIAKRLVFCREYEEETISLISTERERVYNALLQSEDIEPIKSEANFILCRYKDSLDKLLSYLMQNGIYVRDCRNFDGLDGDFFRIGIRRPKENELLLSMLISI